jgi:hypothetical protein
VTFSTEYGVLYQGSAELVDPSNFLDSQNILNKEKEGIKKEQMHMVQWAKYMENKFNYMKLKWNNQLLGLTF